MKKVKMFSMVVLALAIIVVSYDSFAATQMQTVTADLPIILVQQEYGIIAFFQRKAHADVVRLSET